MKMKAAVLKGEGILEVEEVEFDSSVKEQEVLVEVNTAAICGTDTQLFIGARKAAHYPIILGHECSGLVKNVGSGVKKVQVGDHVTFQPNYACDRCEACLTGRYNICQQRPIPGVNIDGCFAQYIKVPERFIWKLPAGVSFAHGALVEPTAVAVHAVKRSRVLAGEVAVVVGLGPIGSLVAQLLKVSGATVIGLDINSQRGQKALDLGADYYINPEEGSLNERISELSNGLGADLVFETAGTSHTVEMVFDIPKPGGRVVLIGLSMNAAKFVPIQVVRRELEIIGSIIYVQEFRQAIKLITEDKINLDAMIGPTFNLKDIKKALDLVQAKTHLKIMIKCN